MKTLMKALFFAVLAFLSACGGGGGGGGSVVAPPGSSSNPPTTPNYSFSVKEINNMVVAAGVVTVIKPQVTSSHFISAVYTITVSMPPQHGSLIVTDGGRSLTYVSEANFDGIDSFEYVVTGAYGEVAKSAATLNVFPIATIRFNAPNSIMVRGDRIEVYGNNIEVFVFDRTSYFATIGKSDGVGLLISKDGGNIFENAGQLGSSKNPLFDPLPPIPLLKTFTFDNNGNGQYGMYFTLVYDRTADFITEWDKISSYQNIRIAPKPIVIGDTFISGPAIHTLDLSGTLYTSSDTGATWSSFVPSTVQKIDSRVSLHKAPDGIIHILANDTMSGFYHATFDPVSKVLSSFVKITEALPVEADPYRKKDVLVFSGSCVYFPYKDASAGLHILKSCDNGNNWIDVFVSSNITGTLDTKGPFLQEAWMDSNTLDLYTIEESQNHKGYAYLAMRKYANGTWDQTGVDVTGLFPASKVNDMKLSIQNRYLHIVDDSQYMRVSFK